MQLFCIKLYSVGCVAKFGAVLFKFLQKDTKDDHNQCPSQMEIDI